VNSAALVFHRSKLSLLKSLEGYLVEHAWGFAYGTGLSFEDAEDISHAIYPQVISKLIEWTPVSPFTAWIATIFRNRILDEVKKPRHKKKVALPENFDATEPADLPGPDWQLLLKESVEALGRGFELLDEHLKQIVVLRDIQGLTEREIAELLEISESTAHGRVNMARRRLRDIMLRLRSLEEVPWSAHADAMRGLSEGLVDAWRRFFSKGQSIDEIALSTGVERELVRQHVYTAFTRVSVLVNIK